jgi:hypothetical protein
MFFNMMLYLEDATMTRRVSPSPALFLICRQLHTQLDKFRHKLESDSQRQRKQYDKEEPTVVQSLKEVSEIVVYGEKSTSDELFAVFCQRDFLTLFNRIMYLTRHKGVQVQIFQTVMILLQNVRTTESLRTSSLPHVMGTIIKAYCLQKMVALNAQTIFLAIIISTT